MQVGTTLGGYLELRRGKIFLQEERDQSPRRSGYGQTLNDVECWTKRSGFYSIASVDLWKICSADHHDQLNMAARWKSHRILKFV